MNVTPAIRGEGAEGRSEVGRDLTPWRGLRSTTALLASMALSLGCQGSLADKRPLEVVPSAERQEPVVDAGALPSERAGEREEPASGADPKLEELIARLAATETREAARAELIARGPAITPALDGHLAGDDRELRWWLLGVVAEIGDPRMLEAVAQIAIDERDPLMRLEALRAIGSYPDPSAALDHLRGALESDDPLRRWNAAHGLALFSIADGLPILHAGVKTKNRIRRWEALDALGRVHDAETVRTIAPFLVSPHVEDREQLMLTLGRIGSPEAFLALVGSLGDPASGVRWRACMALGKVGNVRAILPLRRLLGEEPDEKVRQHARQALVKLEARL